MSFAGYFNAVNEIAGLSGITSFWARSALLSAETFLVVAATAWVCLKYSPPFRAYRSRVVAASVALSLFSWYALVIVTSLLLYLANDEFKAQLNPLSFVGAVYLVAMALFAAFGFAPMVPIYLRGKRYEEMASNPLMQPTGQKPPAAD